MAKKPLTDYEAALSHQYRVEPGGPTVPGVTTVLNIVDKPQLKWAASQIAAETALKEHHRKRTVVKRHRTRLTALGKKERELAYNGSDDEIFTHFCRGEFQRQWDAKAERGTRVHSVAEAWTKGETVDVRAEDSGYVDALEAFHRDYKPKFLHSEEIVLNITFRYGGRFDLIAELDGPDCQGETWGDYKTGKHYEESLAMQFMGYMNSEGFATFDENGVLTGLTNFKKIHRARGIYLHEDGTYEVVNPFKNISQELAWEGFLACLKLYNTMKAIDAVTKEGKDA